MVAASNWVLWVRALWAVQQWEKLLVRWVVSHFPHPTRPRLKGVHFSFAAQRAREQEAE